MKGVFAALTDRSLFRHLGAGTGIGLLIGLSGHAARLIRF